MMNIGNLQKKSLEVKFKDGICNKLCLKLLFEKDCFFVMLLSTDGSESDCPERKFQTITSYRQFEIVTVQK